MDIIIRDIKESDIPSVVDIQMNGWKEAYKGIIDDVVLDAMNRNEKIERMKTNYQEDYFKVVELDNEVVGFARYYSDNRFSPDYPIDCEIVALYIKPELKYHGIGTKLVKYIINEFKKMKKEKMIIWCLKENYPSRKFYEKMGGKIIGEKDFVRGEYKYPEVGFLYELNKIE